MMKDPQLPFAEFFETVYCPMHPGLKPTSIEQYRVALRHFDRHAGRPVLIADLVNGDDLVTSLMASTVAKGRSKETANKTRAALVAIWQYAYRKKWTDERPDVDKLRCPKRIPEAWTMPEFSRIVSACTMVRGSVGPVPAGLFWRAFVLVMFDTGLRRAAALSIRMADLRADDVTVQAKFQKHGAEQTWRLIHSAGAVRDLVAADPSRELLFPWPFSDSNPLVKAFRKILKAAGLSTARGDLFHKIRKTSATHLANVAGQGFVQAHLGHSHASVTARYTDQR